MQLEPDSIRDYLKDIGKIPLLKADQEIEYGRQIQAAISLREEIKQKILDSLTAEQKETLELAYKEYRKAEPKPTKAHKAILKLLKDRQEKGERSLTPEQKKILIAGDRAKKKLVEANLRLVVMVATKYKGNLDFMDAVQEGSLGLMRGAEKFNPEAGCKFSTYAYHWIRQGVTRARSQKATVIRLPVHLAEQINKIKKVTAQFVSEHGRKPSRQELADLIGMKAEKLEFILSRTMPTRSLNQKPYAAKDEDSELMDLIPVDNPVWDEIQAKERKDAIEQAINTLTPREQDVLRHRFGFASPTGERKTLEQVGLALNFTRERARQVEAAALRKLRNKPHTRRYLEQFLDSV